MKNYLLLCLLFSLYIFASNSFPQEWKIPDKLSASINGSIIIQDNFPEAMSISENGKYWCTYKVNAVTDEMRELVNFNFYENDKLLFSLPDVSGSDMEISNSGKIVFYDHSKHFLGKLTIHVYSKQGMHLFSKEFEGATMFRFSPSGAMFGIRTPEGIHLISLEDGTIQTIEKGFQFAISEDDHLIAVASENNIKIFLDGEHHNTISNQMSYPRDILISSSYNIVAVIDKYNLNAYSLESGTLLFNKKIANDLSFRELKITENIIIAGIHKRNKKESTGLLRAYNLNGNEIDRKNCNTKNLQQYDPINLQKKSNSDYDPIPWPFAPFDSMRTIWNHYEQNMGTGGSDSYLHQGLDLITLVGEPTYSVIDGYVKLVGTGGGAYYWAIVISDTQVVDYSDGWASAHLIESTIQFDVGDTVNVHDYLGDIIHWLSDWGHIHFVQIRDSGMVWFYEDYDFGLNFNPMLALQPYPDTSAPYIDPVFPWSKFAFAVNESDTYLQPDRLFGEIDIIVKVVDYAGDSEWQQPAYTTWYTIKRVSDGEIVKPKTLGHILNHKYPFPDATLLQPYAGVIYQRDATLPPSDWENTVRNHYHNLTNSNGDSLVELSEKVLAFDTEAHPDGIYRVIIELYDAAGNFDIDSMDVQFITPAINPALDNVMYASSGALNDGNILTINKVTGEGTNIGPSSFTDIFGLTISPLDTILYAVRSSSSESQILRVNSLQGDSYVFYTFVLPNMAAISFDTSGTLYGACETGEIYSIDLTNGTYSLDSTAPIEITAITFEPATNDLWATIKGGFGEPKDGVYKIDLSTGDTTSVGETGFNTATNDLAFDENGVLYGIKETPSNVSDLFTIDVNTGVGTIIGSVGLRKLSGLAYAIDGFTSVEGSNDKSIPTEFILSQNYPNPFNPNTTIKYQVPKLSFVTLKVYDILGNEITTLVNEEKPAGSYKFEFVGSELTSGIYFYKLQAGSFTKTKKMALIK